MPTVFPAGSTNANRPFAVTTEVKADAGRARMIVSPPNARAKMTSNENVLMPTRRVPGWAANTDISLGSLGVGATPGQEEHPLRRCHRHRGPYVFRVAAMASSTRDESPSLVNTCDKCVSTVRRET